MEVIKLASQEFIIRFLRILNNIRDVEAPPGSWLKAIIIPVCKKRNIKVYKSNIRINLSNSNCIIYTSIIKNKLYTYHNSKADKEQNRFIIYIIKT
jgi:hypothetical protein